MRLIDVKEGEKVKIINIIGGCGLKNRLASIGIYPGAEIKVVKSSPGPFIVETAGSRFAIGKGMAARIEVEK